MNPSHGQPDLLNKIVYVLFTFNYLPVIHAGTFCKHKLIALVTLLTTFQLEWRTINQALIISEKLISHVKNCDYLVPVLQRLITLKKFFFVQFSTA